ncbi:unnamed protein product [Lepeophtheirus salmonis]|uniref:(salmon louse) hypothetical protein n=1 Tax=Lepeophtheirus salmonis TaxID=72036 RepID=A0A0K2T0J0_LEPSM|nr:unnamed protein product [Lepeophtheirus salmonis]CAF2983020.1 unnamed protein product [Lepeophtheirus salmonis]
MSEGSVKLSLLLLGLIVSATFSLEDLLFRDSPVDEESIYFWSLLGVILCAFSVLILSPLSEICNLKTLFFTLTVSTSVALSLCIFLHGSSFKQSLPLTKETVQHHHMIPSQVHIENSSILIYHEEDCIQDLKINDTDFTNCSLSCPIDSLQICETFNYMILCSARGNDVSFSKELKLKSVPSLNESCESEYKLRYADRVDMELAPGCTLECQTVASWTELIEATEEPEEESDLGLRICFGTGVILGFSLLILMEGHILIKGRFYNLGDKYAYFLMGSVLLHPIVPYLLENMESMKVSILLGIPLILSSIVLIVTIVCTPRPKRYLQHEARDEIPLKSAHVMRQLQTILAHHKLTWMKIAVLSLCVGLDSSRTYSSLESQGFYGQQTILVALHNTRGAIISLPFIAFMGDYLVKKFGVSNSLSFALSCYGMEFIAFGCLKALPYAVLRFLINPFAYSFGIFIILKFAHITFAEDLRIPSYGIFSCLYIRFFGRSLGVLLEGLHKVIWVYVGTCILCVFLLFLIINSKCNRKKCTSADIPISV